MRRNLPVLILTIALPALGPGAARAACTGQTFLSCAVENGKILEVCIEPGDFAGSGGFTYSFGPAGAPELRLQVPMAAGTVTPWNGVGREIWETVSFPNGAYSYDAWHSLDRMSGDAVLQGGVNVRRGDDLVAGLTCVGGRIAPLFDLSDAMAAAGWCWDIGAQRWDRGNCS